MANENGEWPLPEGWSRVQLSELANSPREQIVDGPFGSNLKASEYVDSGVPIIRLQNIDRGQFVEKNIKYITPKKADSLSRHSFREGDIVITKLGDPLGKACIVPNGFGSGIVVADVVRARLDDERVSRAYVVYAINSPIVIEQLKRRTKGTTRPRVNLGHIREIEIPIAPLPEQERIVAEIEKQFTRLDTAVAALERVQAGLARYKASVLKAAVEGRLVPQDPAAEPAEILLQRILAERRAKWEAAELEKMAAKGQTPKNDTWKAKYKEPQGPDTADLPELPVGWVWIHFGDFIEIQGGSQPPKSTFRYEPSDGYVRLLQIRDFGEAPVPTYIPIHQAKKTCEKSDVMIARYGASLGRIMRGMAGAYNVAMVKTIFDSNIIEPNFLFHLLQTPYFQTPIHMISRSAQNGFNKGDLNPIALPLPPIYEQRRIVDEIEKRVSVVETNEDAVALDILRADRLRQAILRKAFRGGLV